MDVPCHSCSWSSQDRYENLSLSFSPQLHFWQQLSSTARGNSDRQDSWMPILAWDECDLFLSLHLLACLVSLHFFWGVHFKQWGSNLACFLPQFRVFSGGINMFRVFLTLPFLSPAAPSCSPSPASPPIQLGDNGVTKNGWGEENPTQFLEKSWVLGKQVVRLAAAALERSLAWGMWAGPWVLGSHGGGNLIVSGGWWQSTGQPR